MVTVFSYEQQRKKYNESRFDKSQCLIHKENLRAISLKMTNIFEMILLGVKEGIIAHLKISWGDTESEYGDVLLCGKFVGFYGWMLECAY
jgi:hypothetical protein